MRILQFGYSTYTNGPVRRSHGIYQRDLNITENYTSAGFSINTAFSHISEPNSSRCHLELTINQQEGVATQVYSAPSRSYDLNMAIKKLQSELKLSSVTEVSYIKEVKSEPAKLPVDQKKIKVNGKWYVGRWQNLSDSEVVSMAIVLQNKGYKAGILPEPSLDLSSAQAKKMISDSARLSRLTQSYYNDLRSEVKSSHHNMIRQLRYDTKFTVLRIKGEKEKVAELVARARSRIGVMKYDTHHENKDATLAKLADCVGASRYMLREGGYELHHEYIEEQPHRMLHDDQSDRVSIVQVDRDHLEPGDVVFLRSNKDGKFNPKEPTHMGVALGPREIFNCTYWAPSKGIKNARIDSVADLEGRYYHIDPGLQ